MSSWAAKARKYREHQVEVLPGKFIRILRPLEGEMSKFRGGFTLELVCGQITGWDITEADILPPGVGSSDPVPFDTEAAIEVIGDRGTWYGLIVDKLVEAINAFMASKAEAAKN